MSKMPAKKKSCFQITSVTQAQVAACSITDDTESLEDPDESRTEDVSSSEIFDVSRADLGVCDRSSSEETLNNVGEAEAAVMALHLSQDGGPLVPTGPPVNGGFSFKSPPAAGLVTPHALGGIASPPPAASSPSIPPTVAPQQPTPSVNAGPPSASQTPPAVATSTTTTTTTTSCSSRFRVIKLDHGTGEPFRKGRWTCTEFYDRDSAEGSSLSRTVDSIKHAVTLDHNAAVVDRDSGLGLTGGSVVMATGALSVQTQESTSDSGYSVAQYGLPPEPHLQQGYGLANQIGSGASAFQPTGYSAVPPQQGGVNMQPVAPQTFHPSGLNGGPQGSAPMLQKSPIMPPVAAAAQAQQFAYSDYRQNPPFANNQLQPQQSFNPPPAQTLLPPMASLSAGGPPPPPPASQGPSPAITPAGPGAQGMELSGSLPGGQSGMLLQVGRGGAAMGPSSVGASGQQPVSQPIAITTTTITTHAGLQNLPASGVPSQAGPPQPQLGFAQGGEDGRGGGQSDAPLPQPGGGGFPGKEVAMRPFVPESLHLATPPAQHTRTVNLFGINIHIDGDEDSASGASVVAIDNKIEQAMDLVKSHLMYAVREEVEVLKEQIKELYERNSVLERENAVLKSLANTDQLTQLSSNQNSPSGGGSTSPPLQQPIGSSAPSAGPGLHQDGTQTPQQPPNVTSA